MKKIIALLLCLVMAAASVMALADDGSDKDYVVGRGKLIVGVTDFEPMDYRDENDEWIGFDADLAREVAAYLGVDVEFVEIDWDNKILELDSKNIDCVWNGMTLRDDVLSAMSCTKPYMLNAQAVILRDDIVANYTTEESLSALTFAVENGSAGQDEAEARDYEYNGVLSQADALMEVEAGVSGGAIIDLLMAKAMTGAGTSYADLAIALLLNEEEYGVGFRTGSDLAEELNAFLDAKIADGSLVELAKKYGLENALITE